MKHKPIAIEGQLMQIANTMWYQFEYQIGERLQDLVRHQLKQELGTPIAFIKGDLRNELSKTF